MIHNLEEIATIATIAAGVVAVATAIGTGLRSYRRRTQARLAAELRAQILADKIREIAARLSDLGNELEPPPTRTRGSGA